MSARMNKAVARRYFEEFLNRGNLSVADDIFSSAVVYRGPLGVTLHGIDRLKRYFLMVRRAFPDLNYVAEEGIAEGDSVVSCFTMRGTFETEYQGLPGTGKSVSVAGVDIFRVTNGKI
jgi:steroid delta-isomerase-like uncharacterized protein